MSVLCNCTMGQLYAKLVRVARKSGVSPFAATDHDFCQVLPPELSLHILSNLSATDLCLASCVNDYWDAMASDNFLWKNLCKSTWRKVTAYKSRPQKSYKQLYLVLDEGSCLFNIDAERGINYLTAMGALDNDPSTIAAFLHNTNVLNSQQVFLYLAKRRDILSALIHLHDYGNMFLPEALRYFFWHIPAPRERGGLLEFMLNQFSHQFCICNPHCQLNHDTVYVICYSLILLAVDLASPHVKNKMSKREFIRNLRHAAYQGSDEYFGHLYDNIYLAGHVAPFNY